MEFTIEFVKIFSLGLFHATPLLLFLVVVIVLLGQWVGRKEQWSKLDAVYYAFITATTVGYGDFRPVRKSAKMIAIAIAFAGLLLTGIVVAIGVKAAGIAFGHIYDLPVMPVSSDGK